MNLPETKPIFAGLAPISLQETQRKQALGRTGGVMPAANGQGKARNAWSHTHVTAGAPPQGYPGQASKGLAKGS